MKAIRNDSAETSFNMPRIALLIMFIIATSCNGCRRIPDEHHPVFSGDSSRVGVRAMTQKCQRIEVGMSRDEVDSMLGFPRRIERLHDGNTSEEFAFGGVERDGGLMRIVYGPDRRVIERNLKRW